MKTIQMAMCGLMAALVFVGSMISIPVGSSRIHLGNSMILLAGFLFGALPGGLSGGIGSLLYDAVIYGANPVNCLVTFFSKFVMGYFAGLIFRKGTGKESVRLVLSGIAGEIAYIVIYLAKKFITYRYVNGTSVEAAVAATLGALAASVVNMIAAVIISLILYKALEPVLRRNGIRYD